MAFDQFLRGIFKIKGDSGNIADVDVNGNLCVKSAGGDDPSSTPGCPTISTKLRVDFSEADVTVPTAYATLYSYSGSGKFFASAIVFSTSEIILKLTIDSEVILELDAGSINDVMGESGKIPPLGGIAIAWDTSRKVFHISPLCPIAYDTSVLIEAKRSGVVDKTMTRSLVTLTKET